jgi:hypothetical protein
MDGSNSFRTIETTMKTSCGCGFNRQVERPLPGNSRRRDRQFMVGCDVLGLLKAAVRFPALRRRADEEAAALVTAHGRDAWLISSARTRAASAAAELLMADLVDYRVRLRLGMPGD